MIQNTRRNHKNLVDIIKKCVSPTTSECSRKQVTSYYLQSLSANMQKQRQTTMEEQLPSFSNVSQLEEHCYEFHRRTQEFWETPEWKRDDRLTYCQSERKRQMDRVVTSCSGEMLARVKLHRNSYIWLLFLLFGRKGWHTKSSLLLLLLFLFLSCRGWCRWFRFLRRFFNWWTNLKSI